MANGRDDRVAEHLDRAMLDRAARAALRGAGFVEPNPMVGCVIGRADGAVLATAHHERFGGAHAEANALALCRARGVDVRGTTAWVTLEPCNHEGKTPPCAQALIDAGIERVVFARHDPHTVSAGGAETLRAAGIAVVETDVSGFAHAVSEPFVKSVRTGRPWVIAKWAQTRDGYLGFAPGGPRWVSNAWSRRDVHRLRARVDVIVTGVGTVVADDPMLTARDVHVRRRAMRVVVDGGLRLSSDAKLVRTAGETPTVVVTTAQAHTARAEHASSLKAHGVDVVAITPAGAHVDLGALLDQLGSEHGFTTVLVEAGPGLLGAMFSAGLVDEAWVYEAPVDASERGVAPIPLDACARAGLHVVHKRLRGGDVRRIYRAGS